MSEGLEYTWQLHHLDMEDLASVAYLCYKHVYDHTPVKTGNMRSYTHFDYDIRSMTITVSNDCPYAAYQDTETAYTGWWEAACHDALERALYSYGKAKVQRLSSIDNQVHYNRILDRVMKRYNL